MRGTNEDAALLFSFEEDDSGETAVTRTDVPPCEATQEPSAMRANLPKDNLKGSVRKNRGNISHNKKKNLLYADIIEH